MFARAANPLAMGDGRPWTEGRANRGRQQHGHRQGGRSGSCGANLDDADSGLIARNLCTIQLVTIARTDYFNGARLPKTPQDLLTHNLIAYRQLSSGRLVNWRYKLADEHVAIAPVGNLTLSNIEAVASAVRDGLGIGCVGLWHVRADLKNGTVFELLKKFRPDPLTVKIYFSSRDQQPRKVRVFIDYLLEMAKTDYFEK